ncbi:hypothetical protein KSP40_PGU022398 [Platanthera guangdongensis]|uniref:Uncharacterized protein n=1 Tax=Platanthera guangdongensis TaxID=2320717 RepID=A0ABR2LC36_9ASPA
MGKWLCDSTPIAETLKPPHTLLPWPYLCLSAVELLPEPTTCGGWDAITDLEEQQWRKLESIHVGGVYWKNSQAAGAAATGMAFRLAHDGDVEADGSSLFTALRWAMGSKIGGFSSE